MPGKILVVDDSALSRRTLRRILETAGYSVVEAEEGMAALELYFIERPKAVLLDLVMKGMYGLDVLTKLREMDRDVRVLIASADVQSSTQIMAEQAGACAVIHKPLVLGSHTGDREGFVGRSHPWYSLTGRTTRSRNSLISLSLKQVRLFRNLQGNVSSLVLRAFQFTALRSFPGPWKNSSPVKSLLSTRSLQGRFMETRSVAEHAGAMELTNLLVDEPIRTPYLDESAREVLTEVGNILLNACLGMFGNLLQVHVSFSVPRLHLESLDALVANLITGE